MWARQPELYTIELNNTANDVTKQVHQGQISPLSSTPTTR
jgi:hypothetical protein